MHIHMTAWEKNGLVIFIITFFQSKQFIKSVPFVFIIVIIAAVIIAIIIRNQGTNKSLRGFSFIVKPIFALENIKDTSFF